MRRREGQWAIVCLVALVCAGCSGPTPATAVPKELIVVDAVDGRPLSDVHVQGVGILHDTFSSQGPPMHPFDGKTGADGKVDVSDLKPKWFYQIDFIKSGYYTSNIKNSETGYWALIYGIGRGGDDTHVVRTEIAGEYLRVPMLPYVVTTEPSARGGEPGASAEMRRTLTPALSLNTGRGGKRDGTIAVSGSDAGD